MRPELHKNKELECFRVSVKDGNALEPGPGSLASRADIETRCGHSKTSLIAQNVAEQLFSATKLPSA
ncbi:hypothetical protein CYK37_07260 [Mesorhizobium loti]|nr:hypothetical protein CYK37_07260 [Mesorhizobium loti]